MNERELQTVQDAMQAIRCITKDALEEKFERPQPPINLSKSDLAFVIRRMLHAELVHYLRCDASREALQMIQQSLDAAVYLLGEDQILMDDLELFEPFRHHLYATVICASLLASERQDIRNGIFKSRYETVAESVTSALTDPTYWNPPSTSHQHLTL